MDKAALLGSVIDHVKDLKRQAMEVSDVFTVPTEVDEVTVDCEFDQGLVPNNSIKTPENIFIKASVCCEDRPELFSELIRALQGLKLTTIRADMASLSGRTKSILVLCSKDDSNSVCISTLKQSLKVVLSRIVSSSTASNYRITSKRQRFFLPSNFPQWSSSSSSSSSLRSSPNFWFFLYCKKWNFPPFLVKKSIMWCILFIWMIWVILPLYKKKQTSHYMISFYLFKSKSL